jgi:Flp pilus assembly protein protease CpaA
MMKQKGWHFLMLTFTHWPLSLFLCVLLYLSWQDLRSKTINSLYLLIPFATVCYLEGMPWSAIFAYITTLAINTLTKEKWLGNGDIDILYVGFCIIGFAGILPWVLLSCAVVLCITPFLKSNIIPFVPALTVGLLAYIPLQPVFQTLLSPI